MTGLSLMSDDLAGLRLSVLKEAVPSATRVGVLYNPSEPPTKAELEETEAAAQKLGVTLQPLAARGGDALGQLFAEAAAGGCDALITFAHGFAFFHRRRIAELAAQYRLPAMYGWREYAAIGGLMTYGPNVTATLRRAASYVDRILKGANPANLPVEQPTKFELVVNLRTAKALGLYHSADRAHPRRRGDRVRLRDVRYWHLADVAPAPSNVRYGAKADIVVSFTPVF